MFRIRNYLRARLIVGTLPNNIQNGQAEDAVPVMANLNWIINQVNANAQPLGLAALLAAANSFTQVQSGVAATSAANFPIATQVQNVVFNTLTSTLGTNTITARIAALPLSAYAVGQIFSFIPSNSNTLATTLNVNGLGAKNVFWLGSSCSGGEIRQSIPAVVYYDGTQFNIVGNGFSPPLISPVINTGVSGTAVAAQSDMESASSTSLIVTPGRVHFEPGVSKVWIRVTFPAGVPTSQGSLNVSSLTDNGAGTTQINFTTAFSIAGAYSSVACQESDGPALVGGGGGGIKNTGNETVITRTTGFVTADATFCYMAFGDQ